MEICLMCGKERPLGKRHKWRKLTFKEKLKFWKTTYVGFCRACWIKSMLQVYELFKDEKERYRVYLNMCGE